MVIVWALRFRLLKKFENSIHIRENNVVVIFVSFSKRPPTPEQIIFLFIARSKEKNSYALQSSVALQENIAVSEI